MYNVCHDFSKVHVCVYVHVFSSSVGPADKSKGQIGLGNSFYWVYSTYNTITIPTGWLLDYISRYVLLYM